MLQGRHYQNAYVTRDLDKAVARFRREAEIRHETIIQAPLEVKTPAGPRKLEVKLAFLWFGDLQVELIQPISDDTGFYADALPADDDTAAFHHICMRVENWDTFRAAVAGQPYPVAIEGEAGPLKFLYLDARPWLGHYLEYVAMSDEMWTGTGGR